MRILAVDSSGLTASAAVYVDGKIVAVNTVNNNKTHSQTLLPMIESVMEQAGLGPDDLDAIAVAKGPGSFTGLRIGASTVKGLAYAIDKPVIPVSTLEGLAYNVSFYDGIICPIMDARRSQVYTAVYRNGLELVAPCAVAIDDILDECEKLCGVKNSDGSIESNSIGKIMFLGDGVFVHKKHIIERFGSKAEFALPHYNLQNAASIAVLADNLYEQGEYVDGAVFEPVYLRLSQAERERLEQKEMDSEKK